MTFYLEKDTFNYLFKIYRQNIKSGIFIIFLQSEINYLFLKIFKNVKICDSLNHFDIYFIEKIERRIF